MLLQKAQGRAEAGSPVKALGNRKQMAYAANVCVRTIDEWRDQGIIPFLKIGGVVRFDIDQVMAALRERYEVREKSRAAR
jgi:phage terminase Nu1 subunit (DNA packaging protein)